MKFKIKTNWIKPWILLIIVLTSWMIYIQISGGNEDSKIADLIIEGIGLYIILFVGIFSTYFNVKVARKLNFVRNSISKVFTSLILTIVIFGILSFIVLFLFRNFFEEMIIVQYIALIFIISLIINIIYYFKQNR
jgi:hypothetical protein